MKRLILSYIVDWLVLILFAVLGYIVGSLTPNPRPFDLNDPDISYPYKGYDTVSVPVVFVVSVVAPAAIIFGLAMIVSPRAITTTQRGHLWRRKVWEWHAGWLGLALSLILAWFFTSGMKNLFGKPRPNLLTRCQPDMANVAKYIVGYADSKGGQLVSADICTNPDKAVINEGFRSFPSGHSSISTAGLVYLGLVVAAKLGVWTPFPQQEPIKKDSEHLNPFHDGLPRTGVARGASESNASRQGPMLNSSLSLDKQSQAAGAPLYLLVLAIIPLGATVYICASRWYDFQHHGFDIFFSFFLGTLSSVLAFRYYHQPLRHAGGWAFAPRSENAAFWAGAGRRVFPKGSFCRFEDTDSLQHQDRGGEERYELRQLQPV